jgi:biopolymer transport protein ExbD
MRHRFPFFKDENEEIEINMTPMLDVVFILLIFFIVTTSFIREAGVSIDRPQASSASVLPQQAITIAITKLNQIWIDQRMIDPRSVRRNIERLLSEMPESTVIIQSDQLASTGVLIDVLDQAKLAGAKSIAVSTSERP